MGAEVVVVAVLAALGTGLLSFFLWRAMPSAPLDVVEGIKLVEQYLVDGRLMEAMVISKKLAATAPGSLTVRLLVVDVLTAQGRHDEALTELERLHVERPERRELADRIDAVMRAQHQPMDDPDPDRQATLQSEKRVEAQRQLARLEKAAGLEAHLVVEWEKKALLAVKAGNDELAKQALLRKREHHRLGVETALSARHLREALGKRDTARGVSSSTSMASVAVPTGVVIDVAAPPPATSVDVLFDQIVPHDIDASLRSLKAKGEAWHRHDVEQSIDQLVQDILAQQDRDKRKKR